MMTPNRTTIALVILLFTLLTSGCAGTFGESTHSTGRSSKTPLSQMSEDFLYLAAQDAIRQGQQELAIQFLSMLAKKRPDQHLPRLQLAELLLRSNRVDEAKLHIDAVLGDKTAASVENLEESEPYLLRARALAMAGDPDSALKILDTLLSLQPGMLNARLLQVSILASMKRLDEAHYAIAEGLRSSETPQLRKLQADLFIRQNRLDDAVRSLESMRKLNASDETPALLLHQIALQQKNSAKAEQILRDFIEIEPNSVLVRNALGRLMVQSGRMQEAIGIYRSLVRDTGGTTEALSALGLLYYQAKDYENAAVQFRQVLKNAPDDQSRFYLGASLEALEKPDEAKAIYNKIDKKSAAYGDAQLRLASMDIRAQNLTTAEKRTKAVLANHPNEANAYMLLSSIYLLQNRHREILDETEEALLLPRIPSRLLFNRAIAHEHFKEFDGVERSLQRLLTSDPDNSEALNFLGYVYAEQGIKLAEAERLIKKALEKKPDDGYYLDSLAWVYFQKGNYTKALKVQKSAIAKISDDPVMYEHMGDMLWKDNQQEAARNSWKRAIELNHDQPDSLNKKIAEGL